MRILNAYEIERVSGSGYGKFVAGAVGGWALGKFVFDPAWERIKGTDFKGFFNNLGESYKDYVHSQIADGIYPPD